jgi:hypothetical protein
MLGRIFDQLHGGGQFCDESGRRHVGWRNLQLDSLLQLGSGRPGRDVRSDLLFVHNENNRDWIHQRTYVSEFGGGKFAALGTVAMH